MKTRVEAMTFRTVLAAGALATLWISGASAGEPAQTAAVTPPTVVVPTDFQTTWDRLTRALNEGDFTINATIKESATIRVLLQSKIPSTWVDCGRISVHSKHKIFGERNYNFPAANSVRYMVADEELDELVDVERRTSLNALATIRLKPVQSGTQVSVDAQYVMKVRTREFGKRIEPRKLDQNMDFTSGGHAELHEEIREGAKMKPVTTSCHPTGELERHIVSVLGTPVS